MTTPHPAHDRSTCQELLAALSLYLDGEAGADLCAAVEAHVQQCPECHAVLETLAATIRLCREQSPAPLPAATRAQLRAVLGLPPDQRTA